MSTRATILIKSKRNKQEIRIYHHTDGYPEGIGVKLKEFLNGKPYWDVEDIANDLVKGKCCDDIYYEITTSQHGDEEYAYLIDCDEKQLKCYELGFNVYEWTVNMQVKIP